MLGLQEVIDFQPPCCFAIAHDHERPANSLVGVGKIAMERVMRCTEQASGLLAGDDLRFARCKDAHAARSFTTVLDCIGPIVAMTSRCESPITLGSPDNC